jgi:hypothetical protein
MNFLRFETGIQREVKHNGTIRLIKEIIKVSSIFSGQQVGFFKNIQEQLF